MKKIFIIISGVLWIHSTLAGQVFNKEKLGIGVNLGAQKLYCDLLHTGFSLGMERYARYSFNKYFSAMTGLGYSELSDGTFGLDKNSFITSMLTIDARAAFCPLPALPIRPIFYVGAGIARYSNPNNPDGTPVRTMFGGGALEWMFQPRIGLLTSVDYRFVDTDNLDNGRWNGVNDGYFNIRTGFTYYFTPNPPDNKKVLANAAITTDPDIAPSDKIATENELDVLLQGIEKQESTQTREMGLDKLTQMETRLKTLHEKITEREQILQELNTQLNVRIDRFNTLTKQDPEKPTNDLLTTPSNAGDLSSNYNEGLKKFYAHEYDAAIQIFNSILTQYSNNKLLSNCRYWIGESFFGKRQYQEARMAFQQVLEFADSLKKDDALKMIGRCDMKLGQR